MTDVGKARLAAVVALAIAAGALAYVAFGNLEKNLVYYWDAPQLLSRGKAAQNATIRLGGLVQKGSVIWQPQALHLEFRVGTTAEGGPSVPVQATGAPPQMFQESMGVVVEGTFDGALFHADRVMVKHSNEYRPPKDGERPQELYKTLVDQ